MSECSCNKSRGFDKAIETAYALLERAEILASPHFRMSDDDRESEIVHLNLLREELNALSSDIGYERTNVIMHEFPTGEMLEYDCEETYFYCPRCHWSAGIYAMNVDGNTFSVRPKYCPECGTRVMGFASMLEGEAVVDRAQDK